MWHVICFILYIVAFVELSLITRSNNVVGEEEVNLGSYDAKVHIGTLPNLYNLTNEDERASANAGKTLEQLRNFFPTGILSLPPLDPYKSSKFNLITITLADTSPITGKIEIHEVLLQGGKSFNLKSLQIRMRNNLRADFDVEIPSLHGHVSFQADLRLGGILPIKLKGKVNFNIKEIRAKGAVGVIETSKDGKAVYQLQNLNANIHADEVHIILKGFGRSLIRDMLRFLKKAHFRNAPSIESAKDLINNYVAEKAVEEVNKMLNGFTVNQIKGFLQNTINL